MPKYRKKPVVIEAEQFFKDQEPHPEGVERAVYKDPISGDQIIVFFIKTLEGDMTVSEGDFVITGVKGGTATSILRVA